jgi:hypothetical protein
MSSIPYDPLAWVTSMQRSLREYVLNEIHLAISDEDHPTPNPVGLAVFDVVFDYPFSANPALEADLSKTIIHFEIDDIENIKLGFGPDVVDDVYTPGDITNPATVVEREARCHKVNFDVGVWASDLSGGSTQRLLAYELLEKMFGGELARDKCMGYTQGVELFSFQGGRFVVDTINDVRVFRVVGGELVVRVYSRKDGNELIVPDEFVQDPQLTIPPLAITE